MSQCLTMFIFDPRFFCVCLLCKLTGLATLGCVSTKTKNCVTHWNQFCFCNMRLLIFKTFPLIVTQPFFVYVSVGRSKKSRRCTNVSRPTWLRWNFCQICVKSVAFQVVVPVNQQISSYLTRIIIIAYLILNEWWVALVKIRIQFTCDLF